MSDLSANIAAHNKYAFRYDKRHLDIFNETEQERLDLCISRSISLCPSDRMLALDFGCGTGNVSARLASAGINVVSADISENNLTALKLKLARYSQYITPLLIDGVDNAALTDFRFDLIYLYSVLHHIPDYIAALESLLPLLKSNAILVIDHEASPLFWQCLPQYKQQARALVHPLKYTVSRLKLAVTPSYLRTKVIQALVNPYFQPEGDIHVWPHDHISWELIDSAMSKSGLSKLYHSDYLVYKPYYDILKYRNIIDSNVVPDMRVSLYMSP